jgi:SAM-dependent methyltransferase
MANNINLTDMETCYKAVRSEFLKRLRLTSDRFGLEPEITARLARSGARIYEVPISYRGRTYAEGKSIGWRDGLEALWLIFKFRFIDTRHTTDSGHVTLESLSVSPSISKWMLSQFSSHIGDRVLEAGCGAGNLTEHLIDRSQLTVVDLDPMHMASMERKFGHLENVTTLVGDLEDSSLYSEMEGSFDSVLCVNVLEHLDGPHKAVSGFRRVLRPGGVALILVPAHQWLFSDADRALGHRLRYNRAGLTSLIEGAGFEVVEVRQFNRLGVLGWLVNKWAHRTDIGRFQARAFGWLLPLARLLERMRFLPGLSWVVVARTP